MAASKGMPLLAIAAAIMVVSYTVFRLNYAANNLPYDPGDPLPPVEVIGSSPKEVPALVRNAIISRHSVRLTPPTDNKPSGGTNESTLLEVWPLRGLELERAILRLDGHITSAREQQASELDANSSGQLAVLVAARELVEQDRAFVIEGTPPATVPGWHTKLLPLFKTKSRTRVLYIAINDAEFALLRTAPTAAPKTLNPR